MRVNRSSRVPKWIKSMAKWEFRFYHFCLLFPFWLALVLCNFKCCLEQGNALEQHAQKHYAELDWNYIQSRFPEKLCKPSHFLFKRIASWVDTCRQFLFFVRSHVPIYNSKYPCLDIRCLNSSCTTSNPATSAQFHTGILVQLVAVNANFCQSLMLRCSYTKDRKGAWSYSVCVIVTSLWICSITVFHHHRLFTLSRDDSSEYRVCPTSGPFVLEQWD